MTEDPTAAAFTPYVGGTFTLRSPEGDVPLVLAEVTEEEEQPHAPRTHPFSLVFTAPAGYGFTQGMYALRHDDLGDLALFLVPRRPERDGLPRLEAVFN